ncbi:uncharacterized protein [Paramisgurnus dabryanus]|uniref:uncharacterized protein n=1 Tax=Paramisgurnus dabryanus TaxID=90735 RepID=UPI003CCFCECE
MHSNQRLKGWRCPYQSSPNIFEAVDNEHHWYLQQNATAPWRNPRSRWEVASRERRTSPSISNLTLYNDEPWRSQAVTPRPGLFLSRTRSVPEALNCLSTPTLHSSFSSITISARSLSPNRSRLAYSSSRISPVNLPGSSHRPLVMTNSKNKTSDCVTVTPPKRKAIVVTVNERTEQHSTNNIIRFQASPGGWPVDQTDSSSSSKTSDRLFRSCAHIYVHPSQLSRSTVYLDKSLSIPLGQLQKYSGTLHRSTLSISLGRRSSNRTLKRSRIIIQPKRSYSDWDISGIGVDGKEKLPRHPMDAPTSSALRNNTSSISNTQYSTLTSLTFRTRCHSSSASFRVNGKANDVLGPPQSNLRAIQAFSKHSEPVLSKMLDSPAIFKTISSAVSVEHLGHRNTITDPDLQSPEAKTLSKQIWGPKVHVTVPRQVQTVSHTAEKVRRGIEWSVSPHLINCTCASRPDQYDTKLRSLSLREALELFRPDFISRSQNRLRRLEQRARQRRSLNTAEFSMAVETANFRPNCTKPHPLSDNLFKPRDRAISGKEMQWRSRRIYKKLPEVTKKKEDEKKRLMSQTNRLRVEVFKKKLLDQVLQRHSD